MFGFSCFYLRRQNGFWKTDDPAHSATAPTAQLVKVSAWRCRSAEDNRGLLVYFDPFLEDISIRLLTAPERADRLTSRVSVSASGPMADAQFDLDYDPKHIELNDGPS